MCNKQILKKNVVQSKYCFCTAYKQDAFSDFAQEVVKNKNNDVSKINYHFQPTTLTSNYTGNMTGNLASCLKFQIVLGKNQTRPIKSTENWMKILRNLLTAPAFVQQA